MVVLTLESLPTGVLDLTGGGPKKDGITCQMA